MRTIKFVFVACVVILIVSLGFNVYLYDSLNNGTNELQSQVAELTNQNTVLQEQICSLQNITSALQDENVDLKELLANPPYLSTSLEVENIYTEELPWPYYRLYIEGKVYNTGSGTAYNCRLNVTIYRYNQVVVNTLISLGTIESASSTEISTKINYQGDSLTNWTIIPEYDLI